MSFKEITTSEKNCRKIGTIVESDKGEVEFHFSAELALYDKVTGKYFKLKKAINKADNLFIVDLEDENQVKYLGQD
jgi:hypothetical protein